MAANMNIPPRNTDTPGSGSIPSSSSSPLPRNIKRSPSVPHGDNIDIISALNDDSAPGPHDQQPRPLQSQMTLEVEGLWEQSLKLMGHLKEDRKMSLWDVVTLNLNSMIGTGIFTTPGLVLALTRSKTMTMMFWVAGGIYAMLGVYIYGRYSKYMFVNGGEFLWLDAVFKRPKYLFAIAVAGFFFVLDTTAGNCLAFSKHIALMREPGATRTEDLERDTIAYLAVCVLTVVCFIHFFSPRVGLFLNKYFAWFKVGFLLTIIVAGFVESQRSSESGAKEDWGWHEATKPPLIDVLSALIFIIYSYTGWQTAFYVSGEVGEEDKPKQQDLRRGTVISVLITTILYILTTAAYCLAVPFHKLVGSDTVGNDLTIVVNFIPSAFNNDNTVWAKLFVAFCAFGFLISTIYSYSRLNQKIFRQGFFPFYQLCDRDHPYYKTPIGGLIVHWFFTTLTIVITPNTPGGYGFMINVKSYGHLALTFFLGIGIFFLHTARPTNSNPTKKRVLASGALLAIMSLFLLVVSALGHGYPPHWLWPVSVLVVVSFFGIYWALFTLWVWRSGYHTGKEGWNTIRVYEYYPQVQRVQREMMPNSKRISRMVYGSPSLRGWSQSPPPPQAGGNDQVFHIGGGQLGELKEVKNENQEIEQGNVDGGEDATGSEEDVISYRVMEKLAYRWNMWGETRLIVYSWSPSITKRLEQMYTFFGMPHQHLKPIPQANWLRVGYQAGTFNSTMNGITGGPGRAGGPGSAAGDQEPYYMIKQPKRGSVGSPFNSWSRYGGGSASGTPPPVAPSPSSRASPMLLGRNPGQQQQQQQQGPEGGDTGSAGRYAGQNHQGGHSRARAQLPRFDDTPPNQSPSSKPRV